MNRQTTPVPKVTNRWSLSEHVVFDEKGKETDMHLVSVTTARGTGRTAVGWCLVHKDLRDNRQVIAWAIRSARSAAMNYRKDRER